MTEESNGGTPDVFDAPPNETITERIPILPHLQTPRPAERAAPRSRTAPLSAGMRAMLYGALILAAVSLLANLVLLAGVFRLRNLAATSLDSAIGQVQGLCGPNAQPIVFPISQTIRFKGDFPIPEGLVFPFKGTFPINTTVRIVMQNIPGSPAIEVPINTTFPIDIQVPLPSGMSIPIDTQVPVRQEFPIDLCASGGPASKLSQQALDSLRSLRKGLDFP